VSTLRSGMALSTSARRRSARCNVKLVSIAPMQNEAGRLIHWRSRHIVSMSTRVGTPDGLFLQGAAWAECREGL
jgi:hypothetical protein